MQDTTPITQLNYANILEIIKDYVSRLGDEIYHNWQKAYTVKIHSDGVDLSTNYDYEIEKRVYDFLYKNFPDHGFHGEELKELNTDAEYTWYLDPIDGSKFFIEGIPLWTVSIALVRGSKPVLGVTYNPVSKQLYYAAKGQGAYLNGNRMENRINNLEKSQISWDFPYTAYTLKPYKFYEKFLDYHKILALKSYRVRNIGSATLSLAWLSQGMFSAYVSPYRTKDSFIDLAAGIIIAEEAGAKLYRQDLNNDNETIIMATPEVLTELLHLFSL